MSAEIKNLDVSGNFKVWFYLSLTTRLHESCDLCNYFYVKNFLHLNSCLVSKTVPLLNFFASWFYKNMIWYVTSVYISGLQIDILLWAAYCFIFEIKADISL